MNRLLPLLIFLCSYSCFGQELLTISDGRAERTTRSVSTVRVFSLNDELSKTVTEGSESQPEVTPVKLVEVNTKSDDFLVSIEDKDRNDCRSKFTKVGRFFVGSTKGEYWFRVVDFEARKEQTVRVLVDVSPAPEPPKPEPDPKPPTPEPQPQPAKNLSVLVVYETSATPQLSPDRLAIFQSSDLRNWLNSKCAKDATGTANYRFLDQHTTFPANCDLVFCKLFKEPRDTVPWLYVGDGGTVIYSGPLPESVDAFKAVVGRFAKNAK